MARTPHPPITTTARSETAAVGLTSSDYGTLADVTDAAKGGKAVMNGQNAGDMNIGFGAGIQAKAVKAGGMVELASAKSAPLASTPDAPMLKDFGVEFTNYTMFLIAGPAGRDAAARDAIAGAISKALTTDGSEAAGFITKGFGGVKMIQGDELSALISAGFDSAGSLSGKPSKT